MIKAAICAAALLAISAPAHAFPIAVGAVGLGLLGVLALPVFALAGAVAVLWKSRSKKAVAVSLSLMLLAVVAFLSSDFGKRQGELASLFTPAQSDYLNHTSPFPFMESEAQRSSSLGVSPKEFLELVATGEAKVIKLTSAPNLLTERGALDVNAIWRDKDLLVNQVALFGGSVVLVDEFGGIAGTVAEAAGKHFGLEVRFLQGGTTALSKAAWAMVDSGVDLGGIKVPLEEHHQWIEANPDAVVLSITKDDEFIKDGWLFGDETLTLADFLSSYHTLPLELLGRSVFVSGFETFDTGGTQAAVYLLARAGIKTYYVDPDPEEILIKPAYYSDYTNVDRIVSLQNANRYVTHNPDVHFLDFSEKPWANLPEALKGRYHHLPMTEVAKGNLESFVDSLNPLNRYVGLAFDRRTAYHSILAGELLADRGVRWLGRFTQPQTYSQAFHDGEELNTWYSSLANAAIHGLSVFGLFLLGNGWLVIAASGLVLGAATTWLLALNKAPALVLAVGLMTGLSMAVNYAGADYGISTLAQCVLGAFYMACSIAFYLYLRNAANDPIEALSNFSAPMPEKASLLNVAYDNDLRVPRGIVVAEQDQRDQSAFKGLGKNLIVRSLADGESVSHGETAGIYETVTCTQADVLQTIELVMSNYPSTQNRMVLVQQRVEADWYGVIQYQAGERSGYLVCELGSAGSVTEGKEPEHRFEIPLWDVKAAPKLARKAAKALLALADEGIDSLEVAVSRNGSVTVLQASKTGFRACAKNMLMKKLNRSVLEIANELPNALAGALTASLAPSHIFAFGSRMFVEVMTPAEMKRVLNNDLDALGFTYEEVTGLELKAALDRQYERGTNLPRRDGVLGAADALKNAANTVGRVNRVATLIIDLGCDDELAAAMMAVKEESHARMYGLLERLQPELDEITQRGKADELMAALGTQVGNWRADDACTVSGVNSEAALFKTYLASEEKAVHSWRVPVAGISGQVVRAAGEGRGIVVIDDCDMQHLPLLDNAVAIIAHKGAVTSHLMQHAAWKRIPVVIGSAIATELKTGELVTIKADGSVSRA